MLYISVALIFFIISGYFLIKSIHNFIGKGKNGNLPFIILTILIFLYMIIGILYVYIINIKFIDASITVLTILLTLLGTYLGYNIFIKKLFNTIKNTAFNKCDNKAIYTLKIIASIIITFIFLVLISIPLNYALVLSFNLLDLPNSNGIGVGLIGAIGLNGLGFSIGIGLLLSGFLTYLNEHILYNTTFTKSKKIIKALLYFLLFILLFNVIHLNIMYGLIISFKALESNLNFTQNILALFAIGIPGSIVSIIEGYMIYGFMTKKGFFKNINKKIIFILLILLKAIVILGLMYSFSIFKQ